MSRHGLFPAWVVATAGVFAAVAACKDGPAFECDEATPCTRVGEVCEANVCVEARCANSAQCPMESYCSDGDCVLGCTAEDDCFPGYTCDVENNTCVEEACISTVVDCGYREFCNVGTGDCYDAGDQYCQFCDEDYECGSGICYGHYCTVDCSGGQECPSGFECLPFGDENGNIVAWGCWTYCWLFEGYDPGSFAVAPPEGTILPVNTPPGVSP